MHGNENVIGIVRLCLFLLTLSLAVALCPRANAQDNYEIQVYSSDTVPANTTMVEIHSKFTVDGQNIRPGAGLDLRSDL
jgi:hypothetical protein